MTKLAQKVYEVGTSLEEDRPEIDLESPMIAAIDWLQVFDVIRGERPITDYEPVEMLVDAPDATDYHWYMCGGPQLVSQPLQELIQPHTTLFEFLAARLNGAPYFFIKPSESLKRKPGGLDCLDRDQSEVRYATDDPSEVSWVYRHAFRSGIVPDPCVFRIPESWSRMFATESIKQAVEEAGLKGVRFDLLYSFP